jgi:hypothetical protein
MDPVVERALIALLEDSGVSARSSSRYGDAWRLAALLEGVDSDERAERYEGYALSPRSTLGATRA